MHDRKVGRLSQFVSKHLVEYDLMSLAASVSIRACVSSALNVHC